MTELQEANGKYKVQFTDGKENLAGVLTSQVRLLAGGPHIRRSQRPGCRLTPSIHPLPLRDRSPSSLARSSSPNPWSASRRAT